VVRASARNRDEEVDALFVGDDESSVELAHTVIEGS
jgi:hypothetical protein